MAISNEPSAGKICGVPFEVDREGYSVVIPVSGSGSANDIDFISKIRFSITISSIEDINWSDGLTNPNWLSPTNLINSTDGDWWADWPNIVSSYGGTSGGFMLFFGARPVNPTDYTDFYKYPNENETNYRTWKNMGMHWLNLNDLIPIFTGSGVIDPDYVEEELVGNYEEWTEQLYTGTYSVNAEMNYLTTDFGAIELFIMPSHWMRGWKYDQDNLHADDISSYGAEGLIEQLVNPQSFEAKVGLQIRMLGLIKTERLS